MERTRIGLATGVTLSVALGGDRTAEPILLLHGFPESHRTWREVAPALEADFFVVAPDQRGFGGSDKPQTVEQYRSEILVADVLALADALGLERFTLVGHDWGGAIAWPAALRHADRIRRLVIVNAPHPLVFQLSLIEDEAQRAASQYINAFRTPGIEQAIRLMGYEKFLEKTFRHQLPLLGEDERRIYVEQWSQPGALEAMLNWYRASGIEVPAPGADANRPLWTRAPFPKVKVPTLVVWGLKDEALLPVQLGLAAYVEELRIVAEPESGHFLPWEKPETLIAALRDFIAETPASTGA